MSITSNADILGLQKVSDAVALTLKEMREHAKPGMSTKELDDYGGQILRSFGAKSAPFETYGFPGWTCISTNHEIAHGIPSPNVILQEGDLINIDVSAEMGGYWADNGCSFILGNDKKNLNVLVETSRAILYKSLKNISGGVRIADIGKLIETEAKKEGFTVIRNLVGHGIGRSLHEEPHEIPCYYDKSNTKRFRKNSVVAVETFISTKSRYAYEKGDGWSYITKDGSYVAQHEHTIIITENEPIILTSANNI